MSAGACLVCDHCGDVAIESPDGFFSDGDGSACVTCGFPGSVSADAENSPDWSVSDSPDAKCKEEDCLDCYDSGRNLDKGPGEIPDLFQLLKDSLKANPLASEMKPKGPGGQG